MMKKLGFATIAALALGFFTLPMTGCGGGGDGEVIQATPEELEDPTLEEFESEEYQQQMEEQMNQGN